MRLSGLPGRPFTDTQLEAVANDLVNALERLANGDRVKVRAVIDDAVDFERFPGRRDLQEAWLRRFPLISKEPCQLCRITPGYVIVEKDGVTAARKCACGAFSSPLARPEGDARSQMVSDIAKSKVAQ